MRHPLRLIMISVLAVGACFMIITALTRTEAGAGGQVGVEAISAPDFVELGEAIRGDVVDFTIAIGNTSTQDTLLITSITSSCTCTVLGRLAKRGLALCVTHFD